MIDIVLATSAEYPGLDEDSVPLLDALRSLGLRCEPRVWDSGFDPAQAQMCLIRSAWDYDSRRGEFLAWASSTNDRTMLLPSLEIVRWNTDKRYLRDLASRGVAVVPTAWPGRGDGLAEVMADRGWEHVVMKPAVAAGSRGLSRVLLDEAAGAQPALDALLERGPVLVQPFLASVESEGELSLPVLAALHETPPVARVDLVTGENGRPLLIELELIEPRLFLRAAPGAAPHLAEAVARRLTLSA